MSRPPARLLICLVLLCAVASARAEEEAVPCEAVAGLEPFCAFVGPEDLVLAPGGRHLLVGQMGDPGGLVSLELATGTVRALPTAPGTEPEPGWGAANCRERPGTLHVHGIDLRQRTDGRWQLLAVNHAGRESVEFFEVLPGPLPELRWRGCVEAPPDGYFNDVAGLPDGGFLVSHMAPRSSPVLSFFLALLGRDTGFVYRWDRADGFREQAGTASRYPNGVILSPDGRTLYMNEYLGDAVRVVDLSNGEVRAEIPVQRPDNASWASDGRLLVASHQAGLLDLLRSLRQPREQVSLLPFSIVAIDPATRATESLFSHEGAPLGAGTVAVEADGALWIGSYLGDRVLRAPLP